MFVVMILYQLFHYEKIKKWFEVSTGETAQANRNSCISSSADIVLLKR
jgi:hypothetical protein